MNYTQYLQDGGKADQFTEEQVQVIKAMQPYGEAFKQSPGGAIEMAANELHFDIQSPADVSDFLAGLLSYADLVGDGSLKNDIQKFVNGDGQKLIQEAPVFRKCGGKVRAKVKKACGGKRLEKGAKVPEVKKGGCPCQYKKVGGRIIEVDCNGIPVAKNGMKVAKFQDPANPIDIKRETNNVYSENALKQAGAVMSTKGLNRWYYQSPADGKIYTAGTPFANNNVDEEFKLATPEQIDIYHNLKGHKKNARGYYETIDGGYKYLTGDWAGRTFMQGADGKYYGNFGDEGAVWDAVNKTWTKEGFIYDPIKGWAASKNSTEKAPNQATLDWRANFGEGKFGGLTYNEALARQQEMQAAKAQGFNVDLGRWGADGKWGNQSRNEWERYQQWKKDKAAAELARRQAPDPSLQRIEPEKKYFSPGVQNGLALMSTPTSTVKVSIPELNRSFASANIGGIKPGATNLRASDRLDLNTMTAGQALSLNKGDYENWLNNFRNRTLYQKDGGLISYKNYLNIC